MVELNVKIDGKSSQYFIPESWNDITVGQFMEFTKLDLSEDKNSLVILAEVLGAFTNMDSETIWMIPVEKFNEISQVLSFTKEAIIKNPVDTLTVGTREKPSGITQTYRLE